MHLNIFDRERLSHGPKSLKIVVVVVVATFVQVLHQIHEVLVLSRVLHQLHEVLVLSIVLHQIHEVLVLALVLHHLHEVLLLSNVSNFERKSFSKMSHKVS